MSALSRLFRPDEPPCMDHIVRRTQTATGSASRPMSGVTATMPTFMMVVRYVVSNFPLPIWAP